MSEVKLARKSIGKLVQQYFENTSGCQTISDLVDPTILMMQHVCDIVKPNHVIKLLHNGMPQDNLQIINEIQSECINLNLAIDLRNKKVISLIAEHNESIIMTEQAMQKIAKINEKSAKLYEVVIDSQRQDIKELESENQKIIQYQNQVYDQIIKQLQVSVQKITSGQVDSTKGKLVTRLTDPYFPFDDKQDRQYPPLHQLSYDTSLVAVRENDIEFNFVFSNGFASQFQSLQQLTEVNIKPGQIKRLRIWHDYQQFQGFQLFDNNGEQLYKSLNTNLNGLSYKDYIIGDDERIVGIKSTSQFQARADHHDLQFIIGRLE